MMEMTIMIRILHTFQIEDVNLGALILSPLMSGKMMITGIDDGVIEADIQFLHQM